MTIELLKDLTKLNIKKFEFDDLKNMENTSGYDFSAIKLKIFVEEQKPKTINMCKTPENADDICKEQKPKTINMCKTPENADGICKEDSDVEKDLYIKMIKKDKIKESIFCYWTLLYDEKFKNYEESEFTSVIDKVRITETESEEYKHSVLLQIKENKWGVLECGSTIHLVKFEKYLNDKTIKKSKLIKEWKNYIEDGNQDVLFIGVIN